jgi:GTP-binding protein YchF
MLRTALIGFPSSGKTTLFQLMTNQLDAPRPGHGKLEAAIGVARVPDERLDRLSDLYKPRKHTPATVEFADIVAPGRTGAQALLDVGPYRNADALVHVIRAFRDPAVTHHAEEIAPAADAQAMEDELLLADLAVTEKRLERIERDLKKSRTTELERERDLLLRCRAALEEGRPLRGIEIDDEERKMIRGFQFLSAKPLLVVINMDEADTGLLADSARAAESTGLSEFLSRAGTKAVAVCAKIELEIAQLEAADAAAFLSDLGLREPGVHRVIRTTYDLLGYISFLTAGEDECRAWSIPRGTPAQVAASEIHSDIARGFIRAEVVGYDDLLAADGSMATAREHGRFRLEGKDYAVQDGEICHFRFNVR